MSDHISLKLVGAEKVIRTLGDLEPKIQKKLLRSAVTAASRPVKQAIKGGVPVAFGNLKKGIDTKVKTNKGGGVTSWTGARSDTKIAATNLWGQPVNASPNRYLHLVEKGTKPHVIRRKDGGSWFWAHPGTRAQQVVSTRGAAALQSSETILNSKLKEGVNKL